MDDINNSMADGHFLNYIVDNTPDIIYILDLNTLQVVYTNRVVAAGLGYSKEQIDQMSNLIFDIMHEDDVPLMKEHLNFIKTITSDDQVVEFEYRLKNAKGSYNWFIDRNAVFKRDNGNLPVEKIGICQDITKRKQQEEQSGTVLDILQQAEEIVSIGSWEYVIESGEFKWSDGMYRLFNLPKDELLTPGIYLKYSGEQDLGRVKQMVSNISSSFVPFEETFELLPSDQDRKIVKVKAIVHRDRHNKPVKVIGVDLDITAQVIAGLEIEKLNEILQEKNRELEILNYEIKTFNLVAAKDYKETLQQLYTNLEFIISRDARQLSETGKANIRCAQSAIQRMNLLTDDINIYFNLYDTKVEMTELDPNPILDSIIDKYQSKLGQSNGKVEKELLPSILSNAVLFSQLVNNLLDNAIKFRNQSRSLVVQVKYSKDGNGIQEHKDGHQIDYGILSVIDNGDGLDGSQFGKIFDLFYRADSTAKYKGSGIGLAVCKKIMSMHGGFIKADGSPGDGAGFHCYFPLGGFSQ